jgi:hypothetical protein
MALDIGNEAAKSSIIDSIILDSILEVVYTYPLRPDHQAQVFFAAVSYKRPGSQEFSWVTVW